jgi:hypothetical protein
MNSEATERRDGSRRRAAAVGLLLLLVSCGQDPAQQAAEEAKAVASWAATAAMAGEAWAGGAVTREYASDTLGSVLESLAREEGRAASLPPDARGRLTEKLEKVKAAVGELGRAVEGGDRGAVQDLAARLDDEARALRQ